jgi:hypothetical protein
VDAHKRARAKEEREMKKINLVRQDSYNKSVEVSEEWER